MSVVLVAHTERRSLCDFSTNAARSKLPKKRRRVLPVEQPRRKRDVTASNRRVNAVKHPVVLKDIPPGGNKFGVNGMNMIGLALQGPPNILTRPSTASMQPLQARAPIGKQPTILIIQPPPTPDKRQNRPTIVFL
ncbi:hypothetical protein MSG28_013450 [Choristoneura fumiferana]|uniref:Uncharacterized protein n=1 Tax=Choristoneura fumiferana TaxID=7141 RepID=A0ACC0KU03_CHOFU|nr:hypothetical protein MSG28_013450 [Choristoneura fumiferana]